MKKNNIYGIYTFGAVGLFFLLVFVFFSVFNQYHLFYLEQVQLFRFDFDYFSDFMLKPGGFAEYSGAFLTQFFLLPFVGPAIITLTGSAIYFITSLIFRRFNISGILWPFFPVIILISLHCDHLYKTGYTIGFLLSLIFIISYLSIRNNKIRYTTGFMGFVILYPLTGVFAFLAPVLFLLHELFFFKNKSRLVVISGYLALILIIPYLYWRFIYYLPLSEAWLYPLNSFGSFNSQITGIILLGFLPVFIVITRFFSYIYEVEVNFFSWNLKNYIAGFIVIVILAGLAERYSYDTKTELILKIDHYVQKADWDMALEQCRRYPEKNVMVIYFTNLALLKSGQLGNQMFNYAQIGKDGLYLRWEPNNLVPFFGCDIYYHLGHNNEAYRWAFEAMETNGQCPRLLKRLAMASLINGDSRVAVKYLKQLQQSLFYRNWAGHYLKLVNNPELMKLDEEISEKRELIIENDFFTGDSNTALGLEKLLENHPHNKWAFEYYMAKHLLNKDLDAFVRGVSRLKEFGYKQIPVHFEEAILWYIGYSKQNVIPQGFDIRKTTLEQFKNYFYSYSVKASSPDVAGKALEKEFGDTYWYYYHFNTLQNKVQ